MRKNLIVISALIVLSACTVPETRIYSLNVLFERAKSDTSADASIAVTLNSPRYLSQPYIAYRTSPYQLEISRYSKWVSSPDDMMKDAIKDSLVSTGVFKNVRFVNTAPAGFYMLRVNLKKFEMSDVETGPFGELVFDVSLISPDDKELFSRTISRKVKLGDKSFLSLAKGLSSAFAEGLEEIKSNISLSLRKR